ncbi:MAG TPA: PleD family two-component system response regulator [Kiloniellaceae bacterium]|nr:PleD family two-component system response regulator [Kiloniellaceae bacterium]
MSARILVVDDVPANVRLLEAKLTAEYFQVITAHDGASALACVEEHNPDLILSDIMMPGMDGFELCERLKADPRSAHIPVVMVTALNEARDRVRGLEAGADDFLTKPVNTLVLISRVKSLIRLKHMTDELRVRRATAGREIGLDFNAPLGRRARFLIVENSRLAAEQLTRELSADGQEVTWEPDPDAATVLSRREDFDVLIVNLRLGQADGLRLCAAFRSQEQTRHTPILLIIDDNDLPRLSQGMEVGVTDYLVRPFDPNELRARCRTQVRRRRYHDQLKSLLFDSVSMAYSDPLTGLFNRRYLFAHLEHKVGELDDSTKRLAVLMIDIDRFKLVNDSFGHGFGDEVLRGVAHCIADGLRDSDMVARYGGEEFVVVMPNTTAAEAVGVADRLREAVSRLNFVTPGADKTPLPVTVSVGVASSSAAVSTVDALIESADRALYEAKRSGRNATVVGTPYGTSHDSLRAEAG